MPLFKEKKNRKIIICLTRRIGDGTFNVNVTIEANGNTVHPGLLRWLSQMDIWNRNLVPYGQDDKFELPKEMETFLYSEAFVSFISKFHSRNDFEIEK